MSTRARLAPFSARVRRLMAALPLFATLLMPHTVAAEQTSSEEPDSRKPTVTDSTTGSAKYRTEVQRETQGKLTAQDFRQVSTLGSQILTHVNAASKHIVDEQPDAARTELAHAQTLIGVIRDLLPTTTVTTVVKARNDEEVYRYVEKVQDDQIPLYKGMVALDVLEAMVDKKKEAAALKGIRLADAELIHTAALLDLDYVERKVERAAKLIDEEPDKALTQLLFAGSRGVRLDVHEEDHPLVKAQSAIRLAERMAREGRHEAADENLRLAKLHLETYRSVLGEKAEGHVQKLQQEIQKLAGKTAEEGATDRIRGFWDRVTSWFTQEAGQAHTTTSGGQKDEEEKPSPEK